jgi:hypothetical protein
MKRLIGMCLVVALVLGIVIVGFAQQPNPLVRYSGDVTLVSKDKSSFTLMLKDGKKIPLFYDEATKFTTQNQPGASAADLKEGRKVICMVDDSNKEKRIAKRVDFRSKE